MGSGARLADRDKSDRRTVGSNRDMYATTNIVEYKSGVPVRSSRLRKGLRDLARQRIVRCSPFDRRFRINLTRTRSPNSNGRCPTALWGAGVARRSLRHRCEHRPCCAPRTQQRRRLRGASEVQCRIPGLRKSSPIDFSYRRNKYVESETLRARIHAPMLRRTDGRLVIRTFPNYCSLRDEVEAFSPRAPTTRAGLAQDGLAYTRSRPSLNEALRSKYIT
jgi:hypothetical protein